jgi:hypothetical protein
MEIHKYLAASILVFIGIFPMPLVAEDPSGPEISFRVLCFEHRDAVTSVLAPSGDGPKVIVPLYTSDFSPVIKARFASGTASLYVEEPGPEGKVQRKVVAQGKLAAGLRQAFILIPTDKSPGPVYRIVAFEDGEESFPMGSTRVINLAPFPIRLNLAGSDMAAIAPGGIGTYPMIKKVDEWNMYTARIQFGVSENQWVDVATQSWKASDRKRDWVIARFDVATKLPAIRQYQDIPPWRRVTLPLPGASPP